MGGLVRTPEPDAGAALTHFASTEENHAGTLKCLLQPDEVVGTRRPHAVDRFNSLDRRMTKLRALGQFCPRPAQKRTRSASLRTCNHLRGI